MEFPDAWRHLMCDTVASLDLRHWGAGNNGPASTAQACLAGLGEQPGQALEQIAGLHPERQNRR